jgi:hypothetical protein
MIMLVELLKQSGFTPEQILQKISAMSTPNDHENGRSQQDQRDNEPSARTHPAGKLRSGAKSAPRSKLAR